MIEHHQIVGCLNLKIDLRCHYDGMFFIITFKDLAVCNIECKF